LVFLKGWIFFISKFDAEAVCRICFETLEFGKTVILGIATFAVLREAPIDKPEVEGIDDDDTTKPKK